jgi:rod shape-determining protein MreD
VSRPVQTLAPWGWLGLPALAAVAATLMLAAPVRLFGFGPPEPVFAVALAFAWAAIRPSMLGPAALLLLGLFDDFLWGGPLGLWPFALVCVYLLTMSGRTLMAGQGSVVMAAWYIAGCCLAFAVAVGLATIVAHGRPNILAVVWQFLWTAALCPVVLWMVDRYEDADVRFR